MEWLNYHHLLYFWVVAKEGSIAAAQRRLRLAQPTISGQLRTLEDALGEKLFNRQGRTLELTEMGRVAYRYADEIFSLGQELLDTVKGRPTQGPRKLAVGCADALPKLVTHRLLSAVLRLEEPVRLVCVEDRPEQLLSKLATHELDLVLSDAPLGPGAPVRAYNHLLGECGVSFYGHERLAQVFKRGFPESLDGAPMLLPTEGTTLRRSLTQWFDEVGVRPRVVGEFEDSALLKVFGQEGHGIFPVPTVVERDVQQHYQVRLLGRVEEVRERFYAITGERRIKHPAVAAIQTLAREKLFD